MLKSKNIKVLLISTIQTDWNSTTAPVIRATKEVFFDFDCKIIQKNDILADEDFLFEEAKKYNLFVQVFDTFYFPHQFLYRLYTHYKTPIIYWCFDYLNYPFSTIRKVLEEKSLVISIAKEIKNFKPKNLLQINLNSLICNDKQVSYPSRPFWCIYYGSYRKGREVYFDKYFYKPLVFSTSKRNFKKFQKYLDKVFYIEAIDWNNPILKYFRFSLYIEDVFTHNSFNFFASRFYEALNYDVIPIFDVSCKNTIKLSGYPIPDELIVDGLNEIPKELNFSTKELFKLALNEKRKVKKEIKRIIRDIAK